MRPGMAAFETGQRMESPLNAVLIVVDTLRADHLGCYGYERNTSPNLDALAGRSVLCERHITSAIPTHPAFATLGSGQYSVTHGIVAHGGRIPLRNTVPWLPALLQKAGYTTCAIDNLAPWHHGFGRGYEYYINPASRRPLSINCDSRDINNRAIPWLEQNREEPFFLFIHYWDPHTPYMPPRAYRRLFYEPGHDPCDPGNTSLKQLERHPLGKIWRENWLNKLVRGKTVTDAAYVEALYDGEIRYCDEAIGQVIETLDRLGLAERTLLAVTSDHGEMMYRHGIFFDHHGLYEGNVHVPLLVRHPALGPRRVRHLTAHVDLAPTLLDFCGVEAPAEMEGFSLAALMSGRRDTPLRDFIVCQECTWQMKWGLRTLDHKFILARQPDFYGTPPRELYDLREDPHEFHNLAGQQPDRARRCEILIEEWVAEKMRARGLTRDPLLTHGLTLGRAWQRRRPRKHS